MSVRRWRSSSLYTWARTGCAATLVLEREGVPQDLQLYAVGEVTRMLLEAACRWQRDDPSVWIRSNNDGCALMSDEDVMSGLEGIEAPR